MLRLEIWRHQSRGLADDLYGSLNRQLNFAIEQVVLKGDAGGKFLNCPGGVQHVPDVRGVSILRRHTAFASNEESPDV